MKIMEVISGAGVNGAIQHGLLLTRELARRGHSVTVVCRADGWLRGELAAAPVEIIETDFHRWPLDEVRRVAARVRAAHIDVCHTHMTGAHTFGVMLRYLSGVPCVATAHAHNRHWHWMLNTRLIAVSRATRRFLITNNLVLPHRIDVIPNFVDQRRFATVDPSARARLRDTFGIEPSCPLIGCIGTVFPEKGWPELIGVIGRVAAAIPAARLLVVGSVTPTYRAALEAEARAVGVAERIIWTGQRLDIPEVLSALDVFVSLSRREALGLAIIEAMAAGVPVVAAAVGGIPEVVRDGETGILVRSGDAGGMADAVVALLCDAGRRRHLAENAVRDVREKLTAEVQVSRIEATLARVAGLRN